MFFFNFFKFKIFQYIKFNNYIIFIFLTPLVLESIQNNTLLINFYFLKFSIFSILSMCILNFLIFYYWLKDDFLFNFNIYFIILFLAVLLINIIKFIEVGVFPGIFTLVLIIYPLLLILKRPSYLTLTKDVLNIYFFIMSILVFLPILFFSFNKNFVTDIPLRLNFFESIFGFSIYRLKGFFIGPAIYGLCSSIIVCFYAYKNNKNLFYLWFIGIIGYILAESRAASLSIIITSLIILFFNKKNKFALFNISIVSLHLLLFFIQGDLGSGIRHRILIWNKIVTDFFPKSQLSLFHLNKIDLPVSQEYLIHNISHSHNFLLDSLVTGSQLLTYCNIFVNLILFIFIVHKFITREVLTLILIAPVVIFSFFDFGIIWYKFNICTSLVFLSFLSFKNYK